jgi:hypothetical protein
LIENVTNVTNDNYKYNEEKNDIMDVDLKSRIDLYMEHLKNIGILEQTQNGIRIYADRLLFGTATKNNDEDDSTGKEVKGILFILQSEVAQMEFVHVVESREVLTRLRNTINSILSEELSVEVV